MTEITIPKFFEVTIIPNPANFNEPLTVSVVVRDVIAELDYFYAGEIFSGEVLD